MNLDELLISQFLDDELALKDKLRFLEVLNAQPEYSKEAMALVRQEILLDDAHAGLAPGLEEDAFPAAAICKSSESIRIFKYAGALAAAACLILAVLTTVLYRQEAPPEGTPHRFVLYMPEAKEVSIAGSFNDWTSVPMERAGHNGYWEAVLVLPPGEYRFSYLTDKNKPIADPTILSKERDGFGGMNSILNVARQI
ncbi:glycoside hydrolase family 13 domain protein [Desulfatibacillum aliphaticivorans]|uniref:Glycoside hydrolase family 13 domain protein n=1 Tax=Desulfatibacillum aliphaticivorans TaxID=218208 RepID=B8FLM5_DESAL|nr:glycogen-binding domain-containing protein [Desulfatibacillum aliphaticivorans]ACL05379.1 glycoside hydrolase family 13 domain protein [Desulfatibacillum aliphaticivorans]